MYIQLIVNIEHRKPFETDSREVILDFTVKRECEAKA